MEQHSGEPARKGEIRATSGGHRSQQSAGIRNHLFPSESVRAVWVQHRAHTHPHHSERSKNDGWSCPYSRRNQAGGPGAA